MSFETGIISEDLQGNYFDQPSLDMPQQDTTSLLDLIGGNQSAPSYQQPAVDPVKSSLEAFAAGKASQTAEAQPISFDWNRSQADRYVNSEHYKTLGFNPNIGQENEYKYGRAQTWGDVWSNGLTGMFKLAGNTFIEGWKGWANIADAVWSTSWKEAKQDLVGTPEELMAADKETKDIMNKYAIFETPESEKGVFNRTMFGTMLQQSGFAVGTIGQFLSEELLTYGLSTQFSLAKLGMKEASWMGKVVKVEELAKDMKRLGDPIWKSRSFSEGLVQGARKFVPLFDVGHSMVAYGKAGAGALQIAAIGVGGLRRFLSEANMSMTEARMEAAGTYGDLYTKLYDEELFKTGEAPSQLTINKMKQTSMDAASDNFAVNTGILMLSNRLQFDNLFAKFKFGRSVLGEAGGFAEDVVKVTGRKAGKEAGEMLTKEYAKGAFGTFSTLGKIAADFGGTKAAWEATKAVGKNVFKWEVSEGLQELFQEGSNTTLQDYYYDLYHGYKGGLEKSVKKGVESQANIQGLKTFLMGALTGKLLSPINFAVGKAKLYAGTTSKEREQRKVNIEDAVKTLNAFYENPNKFLPEHIANVKVQNKVAQNMEEAIANRDAYVFHNNKNSGFAKMISAAIKTGSIESVIDTIREYGETFDDKTTNDFKEAFGMTPDETNRASVKEFFNKIADDVVEYHQNWKALTDKYGDLIKEDLYREGSESHKVALMAKRVLNDAIEMMSTTDYKAKQTAFRSIALLNTMASKPVIGGSTATAFRNLGVIENTDLEIETLEQEIKSAEEEPKKDKSTKDLIKAKKAQLKALQAWKENHPSLKLMGRKEKRKFNKAIKAFQNYMNAKNQESKIDITLKTDDVQEIYENLIDYMDLNTDNKEYIDAYNIMANPIQFVNIHRRLMDAMEATSQKMLAEHLEEMIREAQGKPPVKGEDEPELSHKVVPQEDGKFSVVSPKGTVVGKDIDTLEKAQALADELDAAFKKEKEKEESGKDEENPDVPSGLDPQAVVKEMSNGIYLIELPDVETGTSVYYIVDKKGQFITDIKLDSENYPDYQNNVLYENYNKAKSTYDALVAQSKKDTGEFSFGGKNIKQGTVLLDDKGRRYKVMTKGAVEVVNGVKQITVAEITNGSTSTSKPIKENLNGWRLESEVEKAVTPDNPNAFRLVRNNELVKIYPHVDRASNESRESAEERLSALLLNTPVEQLLAGISISITKNKTLGSTRLAADKEGNNENKHLRINPEPYAISLIYNGQTIGYFPYYNQYSYLNDQGQPTDMSSITKDRFQQIFDSQGKNVDEEFKWFKINQQKSKDIHGILINELKAGMDSVTLSPEQIKSLFYLDVSSGEYSYVEKGQTPPTLNDLKYKTIGGFTYIIDRRTKHLGNMMYQDDQVVRTNAPMTEREAIDKRVKEARYDKNGADRLRNYGRYVAAVELPNGEIKFVELSTFEIPQVDLNELVRKFNERSKKLKEENLQQGVDEKTKKPFTEAKDVTASNDINEDISDTIYITVPGQRGMNVNLALSPQGNVRVEFAIVTYGKKTEKGVIVLKESDTDETKPLALKDIDDLVDRINRAVAQYDSKGVTAARVEGKLQTISTKDANGNIRQFRLTPKNFKRSISESFSPEEYSGLQTNTTVDVVKNSNVTLNIKKSDNKPNSSTTTASARSIDTITTEDIEIPEDIAKAQAEAIKKRKEEQERLRKEKEAREGKKNIADVQQDLEKQRLDLVDTIEGELIAKGMKIKADRRAYFRSPAFLNDPRVLAIDQELAKINGSAAKKVSNNLTKEDLLDIAEFRKWMKEHLPEYISDEDLKLISSKMKTQGVTVGMFYMHMDKLNQKLTGRLALSKYAPAYHEAFHAIFRMMLSDAQIEKYYGEARKELLQQGKSIAALKKELLESAPEIYGRLTEKELEERVYEEYLADKFQDWKKNIKTETSPVNKSLFRKLLDLILNFFKSIKRSSTEDLFMKIEKGKFKNSNVVANRFTEAMNIGITEPALKAIQIGTTVIDNEDGERERIPIYLSQQEGDVLASTIAAMYHKRMREANLRTHNEQILEQILDDYSNLYDERINPYYQSDAFLDRYPTLSSEMKALEKIKIKRTLFTDDNLRKILKDAVKIHTDIMGYREKDINDEEEADIDDFGDRSTTDKRKESYSIGGYGSLSKELRQYLSTIVDEVSDEFGNSVFVTEDGQLTDEHIIEAANANILYEGLLKAASGSTTQEEVLLKFELFAQHNPEANKFWNKFSKDVDLIYDKDGNFVDIGNKKQATLFQAVIKGFMQHSVDYYFMNMDIGKGVTTIMEANRKGAGKNQFSIWYNAYLELFVNQYQEVRRDDKAALSDFMDNKTRGLAGLMTLLNKGVYFNEATLKTQIETIVTRLKDDLGISISPLYLRYSYLKSIVLDSENPADFENIRLVNAFKEVEPMTEESIREIYSVIRAGKNPFGNNVDPDKLIDADAQIKLLDGDVESLPGDDDAKDEDVEDDTMGAIGRLTTIASANAIFDEQVATTSFKNANGELVQSHQLPTFNLIRGIELRSEEFRENLKKDPFLRTNFLLNNPFFQHVASNFKVARIDGLKASSLNKNDSGNYIEDKKLNVNQNKGVTYGQMSDREFALSLLNLYLKNTIQTIPRNGEKASQTFATAPVLMGVLAEKNTGDLANNLPIIKAVEKKNNKIQLTSVARQALFNEVMREYERIGRTQDEIDNNYPRGVIDGYHNGDPAKGGERGLRFIKMRSMLGAMVDELEVAARNGEELSTDQKQSIFDSIENYWLGPGGQVDGFITDLKNLDVIYEDDKGEIRPKLLNRTLLYGHKINDKVDTERNQHTNLSTDPEFNMAQILLNNYINALSINQLFANDVAENFKDDGGVDEVKRNVVRNGMGADISSIITAPELGINHTNKTSHVVTFQDPLYKGKFAGKNKEKADAQMYMSVKGLRYTLFGLGKLNAAQADLLDKIEKGISVSVSDIFGDVYTDENGRQKRRGGSIQFNAQTNSIKLVYGDGQKIVKTSGIILTKEYTSMRDGGPRPGMEELHKLRGKLEEFETRNQTIAFGIPKSAAKGKKTNIASSVDGIEDKNFIEHDNRFWRLQLENPSNKLEITDPTQAKQSIISEQYRDLDVNFQGEQMKLGEVIDKYLSDTEQRVKNNYFKARNEIFTIDQAFGALTKSLKQGEIEPKLGKFLERAVKTLASTGADPQTIEFFTPLKNEKTGELSVIYDLNHPMLLDKFTQLFLAYFSKGVMSEKVPGHALTLKSNWGSKVVKRVVELDENGQPKRWEVITRRKYEQDAALLSEARNAKKWNNDLDREFEGLAVGDLYIDDLRHNVPEYDKKGNIIGYFTEFMMPPHFKEHMVQYNADGTLSDDTLRAFGVRIPSQDKHSAITLKLVDFLPAHYGSIGVFPHELIEISGADFDVDKLYMHIMDSYTKDNKRVAYGTAKTIEDKFVEYIHYLSKKDKVFKAKMRELENAAINEDDADSYDDEYEDEKYDNIEDLFHDLLSPDVSARNLLEIRALQELKLPSSPKEYAEYVEKYGEPNNGVLNNRILEAKIKLLNNDGMVKSKDEETPVAFQVAEVQPLIDAVNTFIDKFKVLGDVLIEGTVDVDSIRGMIRSFKNNKEGASGIGPAVNSMLTAALMNSFYKQTKLRKLNSKGEPMFALTIDGHEFDTYEHSRAWNNETKAYDGKRVFYNISAIVSAMTDNAKERLAAKLGLNINAIDVVSNMVALGVPLETALMFNLQPSVREFYKRIAITNKNIKTGKEDEIYKSKVGDQILEELDKKRGEDKGTFPITTDLLEKNIKSVGGNASADYSVFSSFLQFYNQTQYFSAVAQVLKLSKGLGTSNENIDKIEAKEEMLGLNLTDEEFVKTDIPFDLRQVLTGVEDSKPHHRITANYLRIKNQIQQLQKSIMIEKSYMFKRLKETVLANLKVNNKEKEKFNIQLKRDLVSYLGMKAYIQYLKVNGKGTKLEGLTNALIYDASAVQRGEGFKDIVDTVRAIREELKDTNDGKGNYFAKQFLNIIPVMLTDISADKQFVNPKNKGGINIVEINTWAKLGQLEINKLKDSFLEMYSNHKTRPMVYTLFNYLLVKDGGQYKSGSFIRYMPPVMFKELLDATREAHSLLKEDGLIGDDASYKEKFGATALEIFNEFTKLYTTNINNAFSIKRVKSSLEKKDLDKVVKPDSIKGYVPKMFLTDGKNIKIDMFGGIREKELQWLIDENGYGSMVELINTGKFSETELEKMHYNQDLLRALGFGVINKPDENGKNRYFIQLPYTLKIKSGNDIEGYTETYYKLKSVSKEKDDQKSPGIGNFILEPGDNLALGSAAVYEKFDLVGSRKQWKLAGLTGETPTNVVIRERFGRNKKTFDLSDIAYEDDYSDIDMGGNPLALQDFVYELQSEYGIDSEFVGNELQFYRTVGGKKVLYETTAKTPEELYKMKVKEDEDRGGTIKSTTAMNNPFAGMEDIESIAPEDQDFGDIDSSDQPAQSDVAKALEKYRKDIAAKKDEKDKGC